MSFVTSNGKRKKKKGGRKIYAKETVQGRKGADKVQAEKAGVRRGRGKGGEWGECIRLMGKRNEKGEGGDYLSRR